MDGDEDWDVDLAAINQASELKRRQLVSIRLWWA